MKKGTRKGRWPKSKKKTSNKKVPVDANNRKGRLLERVVAALYKSPGISIETNVQYLTTDGERFREIDIVLTANVEGLPVEYVFQCKNEAGPLDVIKISEFVGALKDIGVPTRNGIFVSVNGFTKGALSYAKKFRIQTLVLKGLSKDRLRTELSEAIQHNIFLIPRVEGYTLQNRAAKAEYDGQFQVFLDENSKPVGMIDDLLFNKWRNGEISDQLGTYDLELERPEGWFQFYNGKQLNPQKMTARVSVIAVVISIEGKAENFRLFNADTRKMEKFNTQVKFKTFKKGEVVPLTVISSEDELKKLGRESDRFRMSVKTKLPRMIVRDTYYPLSEHVADVVFDQMRRIGVDIASVSQEQFREEIWKASQNDMFREGAISLTGKEMPVICNDANGDVVDVTLLFETKQYDRVIALKEKYLANPFNSFADLIAWSHVEKGRILLENSSKSKDENQKCRLRNESRAQAKAALGLIPNFLAAYDLLSNISFAEKRYDEALNAIDHNLERDPKNISLWLDRSVAFIKLGSWQSALESVNRAQMIESKALDRSEHHILILLRRSFILQKLEDYQPAWSDLFTAWQHDPHEVVKRLASSRLTENVTNQFVTVEGRLLLIEILYFRCLKSLKRGKRDTANEIANEAFSLLDSIKLLEQSDPDPIFVGTMDGEVLHGMLTRTLKRFTEMERSELIVTQVENINTWFHRTFDEDLDVSDSN